MMSNWREDVTNSKVIPTTTGDASVVLPTHIPDQYGNNTAVFWRRGVSGAAAYIALNRVVNTVTDPLVPVSMDDTPKMLAGGTYHAQTAAGTGQVFWVPCYPL